LHNRSHDPNFPFSPDPPLGGHIRRLSSNPWQTCSFCFAAAIGKLSLKVKDGKGDVVED
jgi:hypothetical protein